MKYNDNTGWEADDDNLHEDDADDLKAQRLFEAQQAAWEASQVGTPHRKPVKAVNRLAGGNKRMCLFSALCLVRARWLKG